MTQTQTITHEVEIDGKPAFSTQLPAGMDADSYDKLVRNLDEQVRTEASAGRKGAEARLELAVRLKLSCPELAEKTWKQLTQESVYADAVTHINAKYGKAKSAYSNHLTELRESREQLAEFFKERCPSCSDSHSELIEEWYLDPNREKTGGGPKKIRRLERQGVEVEVVDEVHSDSDPDSDDDSVGSLTGNMSATAARLRAATVKDWEESPAEFLNSLNDLLREGQRTKAMYVQSLRTA